MPNIVIRHKNPKLCDIVLLAVKRNFVLAWYFLFSQINIILNQGFVSIFPSGKMFLFIFDLFKVAALKLCNVQIVNEEICILSNHYTFV